MKKIIGILTLVLSFAMPINAQVALQGYNAQASFMYQKAFNALRSRRLNPAKLQFEKIIKQFPNDNFASMARLQLAKIYRDINKHDKAIQMLKEIIDSSKSRSNIESAQRLLADIYYKKQLFKDGAEQLEKWLKKDKSSVWLSRELVKFYLQTGKKDEAWLILNRMLERTTSPQIFKDMLALAIKTGEIESLLASIEKRRVKFPSQRYVDFVSDCYIAMNRTDLAIKALMEEPSLDKSILLLKKVSELELKQNKPENALTALTKIRKIMPHDWETLKNSGHCLFMLKRIPEAILTWRVPMKISYMRRRDYFQNYTSVLIEHGLYKEALNGFREARKALGQRTLFAEEMASVLEALDKPNEAFEEYLSVFSNGIYKIEIFDKLYKKQNKTFSLKKRLIEIDGQVFQHAVKQALLEVYFREQNVKDIQNIIELISSTTGGFDDLIFSRLKQDTIITATEFHFSLCKALISKYNSTTLTLKLSNLLLQIAETSIQKKDAFEISQKTLLADEIADAELAAQLLIKLTHYSVNQMNDLSKAQEFLSRLLDTNLNVAAPNEVEIANLLKAHILVLQEKYDDAEAILQKCNSETIDIPMNNIDLDIVLESDMKAKVFLEKAFLYTNKKEYQKALLEIRKITEEHPESFWTNDAMKLALFITRGSTGNFEILSKLVECRRMFLSGKHEKAINELQDIIKDKTASSTSLLDDAKAEILKMKEKTEEPEKLIAEIDNYLSKKNPLWVVPDLLMLKLKLSQRQQADGNLNDNDKIKNILDEFIDKFPDDIRVVKLKIIRGQINKLKDGEVK